MELQVLAQRGLTFGLHLIVAAGRWADFRAALSDIFGTSLELRLGDPLDSDIDRQFAQLVPAGRPGRGILPRKYHFLAAKPRIDANTDTSSPRAGLRPDERRVGRAVFPTQ